MYLRQVLLVCQEALATFLVTPYSGCMTEGCVQLRNALAPWGAKPALARLLGVSRQAVVAWCKGAYRPAPRHALRLEELYKIDAGAWLRPVQREAA